MKDESVIIYVLELENGKYYVGRTKNLEKRYKDHTLGKGCSYTKKYPPIKIKETFYDKSPFDEDRYVIEYMYLFGINNVRGGSYSMVNLSDIDIYSIKRKIWGALDCCFICGRNHFSIRCNEETDIYGDEIIKCKRCLRKGHLGHECCESKNIFQKNIRKSPEEFIKDDSSIKESSSIEEHSREDEDNPIENSPSKCCIIL